MLAQNAPVQPPQKNLSPEEAQAVYDQLTAQENAVPPRNDYSELPEKSSLSPEEAQSLYDQLTGTPENSADSNISSGRPDRADAQRPDRPYAAKGEFSEDYEGNLARSISPTQAAMIAAGREVVGMGRGLSQFALKALEMQGAMPEGSSQAYTDKINSENEVPNRYLDKLAEEHPKATFGGQVLGASAIPVPGGALAKMGATKGAPLLTRLAKSGVSGAASGAVQGASYGALQYDPTNEARIANAITYGAGGAVIGAPLGVGKAAVGAAMSPKGAYKAGLANEAEAKQTAAMVKEAEQAGIANMTGALASKNKELAALETEIMNAPTSEAKEILMGTYSALEADIQQTIQKIGRTLSKKDITPAEGGQKLQESLRRVESKKNKSVHNQYEKLKRTPEYKKPIELNGVLDAFDKVKSEYTDVSFPAKVTNFFERLRDSKSQFNMQDLLRDPNNPKLLAAYEAQRGKTASPPLTLEDALSVVKTINKRSSQSKDRAVWAASSELNKAVYNGVEDSLNSTSGGSEASKILAKARQSRKKLSEVYSNKDIVSDIIATKGVNTNKYEPAVIIEKIASNEITPVNLKKIKNALGESAQGRQTYNEMRAGAVQKIFSDASQEIDGQSIINFDKLSKSTKKIGSAGMKELIGNDKAYSEYKTLVTVLGRYDQLKGAKKPLPNEAWLMRKVFNPVLRQKLPFLAESIMGWMANKKYLSNAKSTIAIGKSTTPMVPPPRERQFKLPPKIEQILASESKLGYNRANVPRGLLAGTNQHND